MSSAALQSVSHQSTTVTPNPSVVALSSGRPYTSSMTQAREGFFTAPSSNNASPSGWRSSRRPSSGGGTGAGASSSTPINNNSSQSHHRVSVVNSPSSSSSKGRVHSLSVSATASPSTAAPFDRRVMSPGDSQRGLPPIISPRTSSHRASQSTTAIVDRNSSRRSGIRETSASPRPRPPPPAPQPPTISSSNNMTIEGQQHTRDRHRGTSGTCQTYRVSEERGIVTNKNHNNNINKNNTTTTNTPSSKSRKSPISQCETTTDAIGSNREGKFSSVTQSGRRKVGGNTPVGTPVGTHTPTGPHERSEVINRIIISHPEVDIERERERMAEAVPVSHGTPVKVTNDTANSNRSSRNRYDQGINSVKREKNTKFGEYYLGGTLGEGEFGKVKMGWKQEGGVQVAIKLIRRDSVGTNPSRLAKIYREIAILREISHPNIVRLHEMVETEKQIGIILEYASGGELFDYILNHRYLKDNAARRLFAQLVSGVGYLHKKGIVHRDLKLENLLLDRNRNIIITDFGFANTFNAEDELSEEVEYNLSNKEYIRKAELDKILPNGHRRGDLMQTSCGSPCYAAPELVVSDSLYTGRKVDVWSCGVILYAMLAGYLPFDDDPANPEGDNINLLYKYIVSTPLTFPEYVSPHARDLLRRILVPDPRNRADLFEVARHSWLAEYAHVVSFITSSTSTTSHEVPTTAAITEVRQDVHMLSRSASVREPVKSQKSSLAVGDAPRKYAKTGQELNESHKTSKDNKRRTVQVEYVAPRSETQRITPGTEGTSPGSTHSSPKKRVRAGSQSLVSQTTPQAQAKPSPKVSSKDQTQSRRPSTLNPSQNQFQQTRREPPPSASDSTHLSTHSHPPVSLIRPATGGSMTSTAGSRPNSIHLTSRASYGQPLAPSLAGTNVQGQMTQPIGRKSNQVLSTENESESELGSGASQVVAKSKIPSKSVRGRGDADRVGRSTREPKDTKGHRRSNTIGGFFSRTNSVFGGSGSGGSTGAGGKRSNEEKLSKKYPPVSRSGTTTGLKEETPRLSIDSRRSASVGFGKKRSGSISNSQTTTLLEKPRRFSLIPTSFSFKSIGIGKDGRPLDSSQHAKYSDHTEDPSEPPRSAPTRTGRHYSVTSMSSPNVFVDGSSYERSPEMANQINLSENPPLSNVTSQTQSSPPLAFRQGRSNKPESSIMGTINNHRGQLSEPQKPLTPQQPQRSSNGRGVLQKNNRRFADAYEQETTNSYGTSHSDHAGSSGAARKVMDFFRRRGRDRGL